MIGIVMEYVERQVRLVNLSLERITRGCNIKIYK